MSEPVMRAKPPLEHIPADYTPAVAQGVKALLPLWIRWQTNLAEIEACEVDTLARLYHDFQQGKTRFLMAFRHPSPADAYCLAQLLWRRVPATAKAMNLPLQSPIHAHFIYDRGIPLWAGRWVGWLYSKLGGTSIQRGKLDLVALRAARDLFANGRFPMVAAPEGGNNGHNEIVSPLEPGIAQLGFWCAEDLQKAQRPESVVILPLGLQYRYIEPPWQAVEALLVQLEADCGLGDAIASTALLDLPECSFSEIGLPPQKALALYSRLYRLALHLLALMEGYYRKFYKVSLPTEADSADPNAQLAQRLQTLLNAALQVAEDYFGVPPKGTVIDRCRRLEQAGWERIFREDLKDAQLSPVERGLADRIAEEADLRMWHMRIVENFVAVTGRYVREKPTVDRFAETVLLLRDTIVRIKGKHPFPRPKLGSLRATVTVGEPLAVSDRMADYQQSRRRAVAQLTQDLQTALEDLILKEP
ncbi:MAG: 1-acyl-sn-glycerol-3-phosphate acyltransferase [Leptolyngbya sp. SIO4C1]|nr:1-acyl-sn-glycerol-3-phosphate acyltransferase [Leptolyngbya sp. SIO4C1]